MRFEKKDFNKCLFTILVIVMVVFSFRVPISPVTGRHGKSSNHALESTQTAAEIAGRMAVVQVPFIANKGQTAKEVKFYAQTFAGVVFVTKNGEIVYDLPKFETIEKDEKKMLEPNNHLKAKGGAALKEELLGASVKDVTGEAQAITKVNYFKGKHESGWKSNIPSYSTVSFGKVYKGIGLKLMAYGNNVEKLFYVQAGADPGTIKLKLTGADKLTVNESGELAAATKNGTVTFTAPVAYQEINDEKQYVQVAYRVKGNEYGFTTGDYDRTRELIIDPLLASTFLGGNKFDNSHHPILDQNGNVYVTGPTYSLNFPTTPGAYDESHGGQNLDDAYVAKFDSELTTLLASTFLGGSGVDVGCAPALDQNGNVYVAGWTQSSNFPTTGGAYDETYNGHADIFVSKLNNDLTTLLASTFLGASSIDYAYYMTLDQSGNVYVTGWTDSLNYPTTGGAYDETYNGGRDAIVSKLDGNLETLLASTFLGGSNIDYGYRCLAFDQNGNVYVTGWTYSSNFPTTSAAYDKSFNGGRYDSFVSKFNGTLTSLLASTFLGGNNDEYVQGITLDSSGNLYVTGFTFSTNFPTTPGAYDESFNGSYDAFVSKFDRTLAALPASTFMGGSGNDNGYTLVLAPGGNVYVGGMTTSPDFPISPDAYDESYNGGYDAFILLMNRKLTTLFGSTYLGGNKHEYVHSMVLDPAGDIYLTGWTSSPNFPTTPGAYDESFNGDRDVFIAKLEKFSPLNTPPDIEVKEPNGDDMADTSFTIQWNDTDPDDDAAISLYYDPDNNGQDGTLIVSGISEDDETDYFVWDTRGIPEGEYYIYAVIHDVNNPVTVDYSDGPLTIDHPPAVPTGLMAAPGPDDVVLTWNANTENDLQGYKVYSGLVSGMDYTLIAATTGNRYTDSLPDDWDTFYYVVTAFDKVQNESAFSNEAKAVSPTGQVDDISDMIVNFPDNVFKNNADQRKQAFKQKLDEITGLIAAGSYLDALNKMKNDILAKTDGCYGGNPNNDWIMDCDAQAEIYPYILNLIDLLETLL